MAAKPAPEPLDAYHWHEALDRTHLLNDMLDRTLRTHPVIAQNPDMLRLLDDAAESLGELYAAIARADPFNQE